MIWIALAFTFFLGMMTWSFSEYALHNWVGHKMKGRNHFSREHLTHHSKGDYFTPTPEKIRVGVIVIGGVAVALGAVIGWEWGISYALGLGFAYTGYEVIHRRIHTHAPLNGYGRWARRHHLFHHFGNAKMNHGVTSPIWDMVFGTYVNPETIKVPRKMATVWMIDPTTDDIHVQYKADYVLR